MYGGHNATMKGDKQMERRDGLKSLMMARSSWEKGYSNKKKTNKIKMAIWNMQTMLKPRRMQKIVGEVKKYGKDLVAL